MKLPRDTKAGTMSWRSLVLALQLLGMFPFSVSKAHSTPKFSLLLCLWSVVWQSFTVFLCFLVVRDLIFPIMLPNVGSVAFIYGVILLQVSQVLMSLTMLVHSSKLSKILVYITSVPELSESAAQKRSYIIGNIALAIVIIGSGIFCIWYCIYAVDILTVIELLCYCIYSQGFYYQSFAMLNLSTKSFDLLSSHILDAAKALESCTTTLPSTTRKSSPYSTRAGVVSDASMPSLLQHLHDIEYKACQVSCLTTYLLSIIVCRALLMVLATVDR